MANISRSRKSGFVLRGGVMRRETVWLGFAATDTNLATASTAVGFSGYSAATLALRPFTIVRTRFILFARSDQRAATEVYGVSVGLSIVTEQALAIGVTALPTPVTDADSDSFHTWDTIQSQISVTTDVGVLENGVIKYVDSKAMRKVEDGFDEAFVIEGNGLGGGCDVAKIGRQLIKIH